MLVPETTTAGIDVVIVAFNRFDLTESCLAHLARQTRAHRVIVVNNGSTDDTRVRLAAEWPSVHVETLPVNSPFAVACNKGVAAGDSALVILLNNDVDCRPDFVDRVTTPFALDPALGSVAALCIRPDERYIDSIGLAVDVTLAGFPRLQGRPVSEAASEHPVLAGPAGTAAGYRRTAWEQLGGLDERIFAYSEDLDLTLRLRSAGWDTVAAPDAVGVHLGSATHGHRSSFQREKGGFGRAYLTRRYGTLHRSGGLRTALTEALVVVGDLLISRDTAALRGRVAGWRAARGLPRIDPPPPIAIDSGISVRDSIALRRGVYSQSTG